MAKAKEAALVVKAKDVALESWEQEEAQHARNVKSNETLGVPRITTRGGTFKIDGKDAGKKLVVLPIAAAKEKVYYEGKFDPSNPSTPECYAFIDDAKEEKEMVAHAAAPRKQNLKEDGSSPCNGCKHNAFRTAEAGNGKRCKDYRRWLVVTPVFDEAKHQWFIDEAGLQKAEKRQLAIPPASLKGYGAYLNSLSDKTRTGSVREMIVELELYSLDNGGHGIRFQPVKSLDKETHRLVVEAGKAAYPTLVQPYPVIDEEEKEERVERGKKVAGVRSKMR